MATKKTIQASQAKLDVFVCLLLVLFTTVIFFRTVFQGKPISKLSRLANWDSIFQQVANSSNGNCDPSLVQLLLPNYFFVAKQWHDLTVPLWNPLSGSGVPLIGDIQASVLSPLRIALALDPTVRTYNLLLVSEVALSAIGVYLLARLLTLEKASSIFAALSYSFCPFCLYYLELLSGTSQAMLPLLLASFVFLARQRCYFSIALTSLAVATFILSGHPESSLYGVTSGVLLYLGAVYCWHSRTDNSNWQFFLVILKPLILVGLLSFAMTSPVLLPFAEYLNCGQSYKYGDSGAAFAPWQGLVLNLIQPCYGPASPFIGIISIVLLPCSVFVRKRNRAIVAILFCLMFVCLLLISRIWILDLLLSVRPFSYLITVYLIPLFLLLLALLSAFGLESFARLREYRVPLFCACGTIVIPIAVHLLKLNLRPFNFDETLPDMHYQLSTILVNALLIAVFFLCIRKLTNRAVLLTLPLAIAFNFLSLGVVAKSSLSVQPSFDFPKTSTTDFLISHPGRALSVIEHVLKPNANIVYQVSSLRVHNPILPSRFCQFVELCGAKLDEFHNQSYEQITEMLDLASVRYLLSQFKALPSRYNLVRTTVEGISIYENPSALPDSYLTVTPIFVEDAAQAIRALQSPKFNAHRDVVLEAPIAERGSFISTQEPLFVKLKAVRPDCNQVLIDFNAPVTSYLVLTDTYYPGWLATVDGRDTSIFRANLLFRAIKVPAGVHQVRFYYWPQSFVWGVYLASGALLIVSFFLFDRFKVPK